MKTYQFWSNTKQNSTLVLTELKAKSKKEVKEWATENNINIDGSIYKK